MTRFPAGRLTYLGLLGALLLTLAAAPGAHAATFGDGGGLCGSPVIQRVGPFAETRCGPIYRMALIQAQSVTSTGTPTGYSNCVRAEDPSTLAPITAWSCSAPNGTSALGFDRASAPVAVGGYLNNTSSTRYLEAYYYFYF